jgi:1-deoxy-D-xylulose-5-phosphate synthase
VLICAIGNPVNDAVAAAKTLEAEYKISASVLNLRFAKPLDEEMILDFAANFRSVVTVEEGVVAGGVGEAVLDLLSRNNLQRPCRLLGVGDHFVNHASQEGQREKCRTDQQAIVEITAKLQENPSCQISPGKKQPIRVAIS